MTIWNSVFDEIRKGKVEISFKKIVLMMITKCWYSIATFKLEAPQKRDLKDAKTFWSRIIKFTPIVDIYTNRPVSLDDFSIDHFIPWSFVLHDQLWNLAPTPKAINSSKSDKLPQLDLYLDKFCNLHYHAFKTALTKQFSTKLLEDYIEISGEMIFSRDIRNEVFVNNLRDNLIPLHQLAFNQGFPVWENE